MKGKVLLIGLLYTCFSVSAQRMVFGTSPMMTQAEGNQYDMRKLVKRSYHLPFVAGDSAVDTVLIKLVASIHSKKNSYCVLFKDDTTRASIGIKKLYPGYVVTAYWK